MFIDTNFTLIIINIVIISTGLYTAYRANKHFKSRTFFDWMNRINSNEFWNHDQRVYELIEKTDKEKIVDTIKKDQKSIESVNYVLNYLLTASSFARFRLIDRKLLIWYLPFLLPYYYEGLYPWISYERKNTHPLLYHDITWLYNYYKKNERKIEKYGRYLKDKSK